MPQRLRLTVRVHQVNQSCRSVSSSAITTATCSQIPEPTGEVSQGQSPTRAPSQGGARVRVRVRGRVRVKRGDNVVHVEMECISLRGHDRGACQWSPVYVGSPAVNQLLVVVVHIGQQTDAR